MVVSTIVTVPSYQWYRDESYGTTEYIITQVSQDWWFATRPSVTRGTSGGSLAD